MQCSGMLEHGQDAAMPLHDPYPTHGVQPRHSAHGQHGGHAALEPKQASHSAHAAQLSSHHPPWVEQQSETIVAPKAYASAS